MPEQELNSTTSQIHSMRVVIAGDIEEGHPSGDQKAQGLALVTG